MFSFIYLFCPPALALLIYERMEFKRAAFVCENRRREGSPEWLVNLLLKYLAFTGVVNAVAMAVGSTFIPINRMASGGHFGDNILSVRYLITACITAIVLAVAAKDVSFNLSISVEQKKRVDKDESES